MKRQERIAKRERRRVARALLPSTARMDALEFSPYEPKATVAPVRVLLPDSHPEEDSYVLGSPGLLEHLKQLPHIGPTFSDYLKSQSIPDPAAIAVDDKTVKLTNDMLVAMGYSQVDEPPTVLQAAEKQLDAQQKQLEVEQAAADELKKGASALQQAAYEALKGGLPESAHIKKVPAAPISGFGYIKEHLVGLPYNIKHDWSASDEFESEEESTPKSDKVPVHLPVKVVPDSSTGDYIAFGPQEAFEVEVDIDGDVILPGAFKPLPEGDPVLIEKVPGNVSISAIERGATLKQHDYGHYPPPYALEPDTPSGSCPGPQGYAPEDPSRKKGVRPYSQKDARMRAKSKP